MRLAEYVMHAVMSFIEVDSGASLIEAVLLTSLVVTVCTLIILAVDKA